MKAISLDITNEGDVGDFLGVRIDREVDRAILLSQPHLIDSILKDLRFDGRTDLTPRQSRHQQHRTSSFDATPCQSRSINPSTIAPSWESLCTSAPPDWTAHLPSINARALCPTLKWNMVTQYDTSDDTSDDTLRAHGRRASYCNPKQPKALTCMSMQTSAAHGIQPSPKTPTQLVRGPATASHMLGVQSTEHHDNRQNTLCPAPKVNTSPLAK